MRAAASSIRSDAWRISAGTISSSSAAANSALDWTLNLQPLANSLTLIHRRPEFRAAPDSVNKMLALQEQKKVGFQLGQVTGLEGSAADFEASIVKGPDGDVAPAGDAALAVLRPDHEARPGR